METKRDKFVRIVENRTNKIIDMLRLLGNCANKANYDYTFQQLENKYNLGMLAEKTNENFYNIIDYIWDVFMQKVIQVV